VVAWDADKARAWEGKEVGFGQGMSFLSVLYIELCNFHRSRRRSMT
jgi:hypothetical protein